MNATERERWSHYWNSHAKSYDRGMRLFDRVLFKDTRAWICTQASGDTLEVAIGTGLNLPLYPKGVRLTGVDFSESMLRGAKQRARDVGCAVDLRRADAADLPFTDDSFDTVVCTFSLCAIPDDRGAVSEMKRVLRPGGRLLLADHVEGTSRAVRYVQRALELATVPLQGEHFLRRPLHLLEAAGFDIERRERFGLGMVERIAARLPA